MVGNRHGFAPLDGPATRMKSGREHRVPLSERTVEILGEQRRDGEFVFVG
jgi:integrase